jgi:hypothetical protein
MKFIPGFGDEPVRWECPDEPSGGGNTGSYVSMWFSLHADEFHCDELFGCGFLLEDWASTVGGGALIARKTYSRGPIAAPGGGQYTEATTLELYHRPQP